MKHKRLWLGAAMLAATLPLAAASSVSAHPDVPLRDHSGNVITDATTPYSPKMTCMGIPSIENGDAANLAACHPSHTGLEKYASSATHQVHKTQGVLDKDAGGNPLIYWMSYNVTAADHGVVKGRHGQQGRNEDYSIAMKTAFKDAYFTSSPGMFGKF